jgi:hypothetical protein
MVLVTVKTLLNVVLNVSLSRFNDPIETLTPGRACMVEAASRDAGEQVIVIIATAISLKPTSSQ